MQKVTFQIGQDKFCDLNVKTTVLRTYIISYLQEKVRVFQIREVGTPKYQKVHIDQDHQETLKLVKLA